MNKRGIKSLILILLLNNLFLTVGTFAKYGGGAGTSDDPYLIYEPNQMAAIGLNPADWDKYFRLMADIDLASYINASFPLIGRFTDSQNKPFTGVFDGNGHKIFNFTYVSETVTEPVGLFSYFAGEIKNLGLVNPYLNVNTTVGALVGSTKSGSVESYINDCYVEGGSVIGTGITGGLVGNLVSLGAIRRCYSTADVISSGNDVGGLVGFNNWADIYNSYADANVSGYSYVGGLIGYTWVGLAYECFVKGSVTGYSCAGGLIGYISGGCRNFYCYSAATVTCPSPSSTGSYIGYHYSSITSWYFQSCFWDSSVNPGMPGIGNQPVPDELRPKTTSEMQTRTTFTDYGWDFISFYDDGPCDIWAMPEGGGYPILWWQLEELPPLPFSGGTGELNEPYLVSDAFQLNSIGYNPRLMQSHFLLTSNIDLTGLNIYSIGNNVRPFKGVFDGNGFTITGLTCVEGLFGYVDDFDAEIKNVVLVDPNVGAAGKGTAGSLVSQLVTGTIHSCHVYSGCVKGTSYIGGILGDGATSYGGIIRRNIYDCTVHGTTIIATDGLVGGIVGAFSGQISNCRVEAYLTGLQKVGGIAGYYSAQLVATSYYVDDTITDCGFTGNITGTGFVGGLIGHIRNGNVINSFADANIFSNGERIGGLVGYLEWGTIYSSFSIGNVANTSQYTGGLAGYTSGTVLSCYSTCDVNGANYTGGLVGYAENTTIQTSFAAGKIKGAVNTGGLIGYRAGSTGNVYNSFWDVNTTGQLTSAGGQFVTSLQMFDPNTFLEAGWDYISEYENGASDEWAQDASEGYPFLWWQMDPLPALPAFSGGKGEKNDPYLITNADQLNHIGHNYRLMNAHFVLMNDIDLTATGFINIGLSFLPFTGTFDGDEHTISNIDKELFVSIEGSDATVSNLTIQNPDINNTGNGAMTTFLAYGTIERCQVDGGIVSDYLRVGGLVGYNYLGTIMQCSASCIVRDNNPNGQYTGGLVGLNVGTINQCYADGEVYGTNYVGGLTGANSKFISDSYSQSTVNGTSYIGGLVGSSTAGSITRCYSSGLISPSGGGFTCTEQLAVGVSYAFWDIESSGTAQSGSGAGRITAQMKSAQTYLGWGGSGLWTINEAVDYPRLAWQNLPGQLITTTGNPNGSGTSNDPYLITNAQEFTASSLDSSKKAAYFRLAQDVNLSEYPVGKSSVFSSFDGIFDGNGYSISGLFYEGVQANQTGLFPTVGSFAQIRNLVLDNVYITASNFDYVGALTGSIPSGAILDNIALSNIHLTTTNCNYVGSLVGFVDQKARFTNISASNVAINSVSGQYIGGIVGRYQAQTIINNIHADAIDLNTFGVNYIGGLIGFNLGFVIYCSVDCQIGATGDYIGGIAGYNGEDVNDCFVTCNIEGNNYVGGLVGDNRGASISRCRVIGTIAGNTDIGGMTGRHWYNSNCIIQDSNFSGTIFGNQRVGGLVGTNSGFITKCMSDCNVNGSDQVGGFVGLQPNSYDISQISLCYSKGTVSGVSGVGGFVGINYRGVIKNCCSQSSCLGNDQVGGFIGTNGVSYAGLYSQIVNCYSTGYVDGSTNTGGLIGLYYAYPENIRNSYWDVQTSSQTTSAVGKGRTTIQMYSHDTFAGWGCDSNNIWTIDDGNDYPKLAWEGKPGSFITRPTYGGGSGTIVDPYRIYTADQFNIIGAARCDWGKCFRLMADIDLSEYQHGRFNTIGFYDDSHSPSGSQAFTGIVDGNRHTISGFILTDTIKYESAGLFAYVSGSTSQIKNLGLLKPIIITPIAGDTGALIGYINSGTVSKCFVNGGIVSGENAVGGLVGHISGASISESYSSADVNGNLAVGGLVGFAYSTGQISNCYASGDVAGNESVGGLLGLTDETTITRSYSVGHVSANTYAGGLIGRRWNGTVEKSLWDLNTSGQVTSDGGVGKTTAQMKTKNTFTNLAWDLINTWDICEGTNYPRLKWSIPLGDITCPDGANFLDFALFADHWQETNCVNSNNCDSTDLDFSGFVDTDDLKIFCDNWLDYAELNF